MKGSRGSNKKAWRVKFHSTNSMT